MSSFEKRYLNPDRGFTHVVEVRGDHRTIYVSGQIGWVPGAEEPAIGLPEQADQAFANLARHLSDAGASADDVIKLTVYVKDLDPTKIRAIAGAQKKELPTSKLPAATWVGVTSLVHPDLLVEVEAIATVASDA